MHNSILSHSTEFGSVPRITVLQAQSLVKTSSKMVESKEECHTPWDLLPLMYICVGRFLFCYTCCTLPVPFRYINYVAVHSKTERERAA